MKINFKQYHKGSCQEPVTVTGEISIHNSYGCDQIIKLARQYQMEWQFIYFPLFCFLPLKEIKVYVLLQKKP